MQKLHLSAMEFNGAKCPLARAWIFAYDSDIPSIVPNERHNVIFKSRHDKAAFSSGRKRRTVVICDLKIYGFLIEMDTVARTFESQSAYLTHPIRDTDTCSKSFFNFSSLEIT